MNREMRAAIEQATATVNHLPNDIPKDALYAALEQVGKAADRTEYRRLSDQATDQDRRRLIGARVPVYDADRYKALAAAAKMSLYRFVYDALERYRRELETSLGMEYDGRRYVDPHQITITLQM